MKMKSLLSSVVWLALSSLPGSAPAADFTSSFPPSIEREWPGPDYWPNPMPDWRISEGRLICEHPGGNRNVVVLTRELTSEPKPFSLRVTLDQVSAGRQPRGGWAGFQIGLQGQFPDYRNAAVFGKGLAAGIFFGGRLFIGKFDEQAARLDMPIKGLTLELSGAPTGETYLLSLRALDANGRELNRVEQPHVHPSWLRGLAAVAMSTSPLPEIDPAAPRPGFEAAPAANTQRGREGQMAFSNLKLSGEKFKAFPERAFGPILWCQHSLQNNGTLKLMAQFPPLGKSGFEASLELDGKRVGTAGIDPLSRTALFKVERLNTRKNHDYTVRFAEAGGGADAFGGRIRAIPGARRPLTMAAFSCNDGTGFPHADLVANVKAHQPDFLAFLGDQIYEGNGGYGVLYDGGERSVVDYLRKYYMHGWAWRDLLRELPSFAIPDDHDVFHGNLWGGGGRAADISDGFGAAAQDSGGYKMPPSFVNVVHRTQAGSLPDPVDPAPCDQGISVYFTSWAYGPLDLAIVADRQWKSAPKPLLPEADILNGFVQNEHWDPKTQARHPDAQLLGPRQERFLREWARRPKAAAFRVVLSQTPWNCLGTLPYGQHRSDRVVPTLPILAANEYPENDVATIDFDANGWPQAKRDLALRVLKEGRVSLHIAGDQHLGSTGRYGLEQWNDGPYWIATPAIGNLWPRRWMPREPGKNQAPGAPRYTGEFEDQFGNKLTVLAAANPRLTGRGLPRQISDRAAGYSIIKFVPAKREITLENWPYWASPKKAAPDNRPYVGWPVTFKGPE